MLVCASRHFPTYLLAQTIDLLLSCMNFNNSACFGYGLRVTSPSFNETILKYFLQKYNMSFLHLFNSRARSLNCSGVRISRSPAFLIEASSPPGTCFYLADDSYEPSDLEAGLLSEPKSKFSNLSIVGFSNPLPIYSIILRLEIKVFTQNPAKSPTQDCSQVGQCCWKSPPGDIGEIRPRCPR